MLNHETLLLGGKKALEIPFSVRMNALDSAYLTRTNGTTSDDTRFTTSTWIKRGNLGIDTQILSADDGTPSNTTWALFGFDTDDRLQLQHRISNVVKYQLLSTAVFRDPAAWYHIVVRYDSNEATSGDRVKFYVNNVRIVTFDVQTYPTSALAGMFGDTSGKITVGRFEDATSQYLDGYLAETIFVDGQALGPENFGETNADTGEWIAKDYGGTFGTNGFRLDYGDAADLGNDVSGNANDFTSSGLTSADQVVDTPTNNHCVLSPLDIGGGTLSDGNLQHVGSDQGVRASFAIPSSGKWYWEVEADTIAGAGAVYIGVSDRDANLGGSGITTHRIYTESGDKRDDVGGTSYGAAFANGDIIGVAVDMDAGDIEFFKNNVSQGTAFTDLAGTEWFPSVRSVNGSSTLKCDFGQLGFIYTPPTGFNALNTANLPEPSIILPSAYFTPLLYTGNASVRSITGAGFQPDLVWIKNRDQADEHKLVDVVRGVGKELSSDSANNNEGAVLGLTSFDSVGFSLGTGAAGYNDNAEKFVAWCWKEGAIPGFDMFSYTGNGVARTIGHNLGVVPDVMFVKGLTTTAPANWQCYHKDQNGASPELGRLVLSTNGAYTAGTFWNNTKPTSAVMSLGTAVGSNENGKNYITYLWAEVEGFSKMGSYTGNGNADGPFVWCGFRPAFVIAKNVGVGGTTWMIQDAGRDPANEVSNHLGADLPNAENFTTLQEKDFLSNGFKLRGTNVDINGSGSSYIFMAFAEAPFKYANAR